MTQNPAGQPWKKPAAQTPIPLSSSTAHLWRAPLDLPAAAAVKLGRLLSPDEQERAARFKFEKDRQHYIAGRGLLRLLLGRYLEIDPAQLSFHYNHFGKPLIPRPAARPAFSFNLSHSAGIALFAFAAAPAVGVDLERIRLDIEHLDIATRFFSPRERAVLQTLPPAEVPAAFFNCWTRKEAYIKGHGEGLSLPLDSFDVSLAPGEPAALLTTRDDPAEAARWDLRAVDPGPGFAAALAVQGALATLTLWEITPAWLADQI